MIKKRENEKGKIKKKKKGARKGKVHEKELKGCDFRRSECLLHIWDSRIFVGLVKYLLNNSQYTFYFLFLSFHFPCLLRTETRCHQHTTQHSTTHNTQHTSKSNHMLPPTPRLSLS